MLMSALTSRCDELENAAEFVARHVGIDADATKRHMLSVIGAASRAAR